MGKYKVLRVGNFYTNDSWYYSDLELAEKYYANYGDLLYTWSATFGPHIWLGDKVIYHYHIWKIELSDSIEKSFAVQLLEQDKSDILANKNGSTMVHITKEGMEQKEVVVPVSVKEQAAIGQYFEKLDTLITLHQRELEKLVQIRKAFAEKCFLQSRKEFVMAFTKEADFEEAVVKLLIERGWKDGVLKNYTEQQLIQNWANILFENNRGIDRLNDYPLTDGEMQ